MSSTLSCIFHRFRHRSHSFRFIWNRISFVIRRLINEQITFQKNNKNIRNDCNSFHSHTRKKKFDNVFIDEFFVSFKKSSSISISFDILISFDTTFIFDITKVISRNDMFSNSSFFVWFFRRSTSWVDENYNQCFCQSFCRRRQWIEFFIRIWNEHWILIW